MNQMEDEVVVFKVFLLYAYEDSYVINNNVCASLIINFITCTTAGRSSSTLWRHDDWPIQVH